MNPDDTRKSQRTVGSDLGTSIKISAIEVTGMNKDKVEKKCFTEKRWLPAVNAVRDKYGYDQWHFIEIANDIRQIRTQLKEKISEVLQNTENKKVEKV